MTRRRNNRAFTLAEMLLSLAVLALLLSSVAVALRASLHSYKENSRIADLTQAARSVLSRMNREIRTATDVDSSTTVLTITPPDDGSGLTQIQYEYTGGQLHYRRTVNGSTSDSVLLGDDDITIDTFSVLREDSALAVPLSVKVRLEMSLGDEIFTTTTSAIIRRNQQF